MRINLSDPRVSEAIKHVKEKHKVSGANLTTVFEQEYHCRVVADSNDIYCNTGWLEITEDKYYTWFTLNFGGDK